MFRKLDNLTFRNIILAHLGAPLLLLWIAGYYTWESWRTYQIQTVTIQANTLADRIITAAGVQALERGLSASLLAASGPANEADRARLAELRQKGDTLWREALDLNVQLEASGIAGPGLTLANRQAREAYDKVVAARRRVDSSLLKAERDIAVPDWVGTMTGFIESTATLRLAAFGGASFPLHIAYPNLTVKHSVWRAAEYAGRERAMLATLLNRNAPATPQQLQQLQIYRQMVEQSMQDIRFAREVPGADAQIVAALNEMERIFTGSFEELRRTLYAEMAASAPAGKRYSLSGAEWFRQSTAAIDTLLSVSTAYSSVGIREVENSAHIALLQMIGYMALFFGMIVMSSLTELLVFRKLRHLDKLRDSMAEFATGQGDLTRRLVAETTDEIGQTSAAFNRFTGTLQQIIRETGNVVAQLTAAADKLTAASARIRNSSHAQQESSVSAATGVEAMTARIGQVADHARETLQYSREAGKLADEGAQVVRGVAGEMTALADGVAATSRQVEALGERSREIGNIIGVIREIADQTNLLALNAAIEAARAGEQGRGFAVVADEVRKLAERTGTATVDISRTIDTIQGDTGSVVEAMRTSGARVNQGVEMAARAAQALEKINEGAHLTKSRVEEIARTMQEQSEAGNEISRNVEHIAGMAEENGLAVNESAEDAQRLQQLADTLQQLVGKFRT